MSRRRTPDPARMEKHNRFQRLYYRRRPRRATLAAVDSAYVRRHFAAVRRAAQLGPEQRILEVGSGSGRFTRQLLQLGGEVVANDLSPELLDSLAELVAGERAEASPDRRLERACCDVGELAAVLDRPCQRAVGFFVLHHLFDLETAFRSIAEVLEPGARIAFCEPNAYNPFFYVQILCSPHMSWRAERGILKMTERQVFTAMHRAGFRDPAVERYGYFPPWLANRRVARSIERRLESVSWLRRVSAFQVFSARLAAA